MTELVSLYGSAIAAAAVGAAVLAAIGAHLATRGRVFATILTAQAISVGLLAGFLVVLASGHRPDASLWIPLAWGLGAATVAKIFGEAAARKRPSSREATFAAAYAICLAAGALLPALFPQLEPHWTQLLVGDVATLSDVLSRAACAFFALALGTIVGTHRRLAATSLDVALYGRASASAEWIFALLVLGCLCGSIVCFGTLFTLAALFVPTAFLVRAPGGGYQRHVFRCAATGAMGAVGGFFLSLRFPALPTAPAMVAVISLFAFAWMGIAKAVDAMRRIASNQAKRAAERAPELYPN